MRTSSTISLFSEQPAIKQRPYIFILSVLAHGAFFGLILLAIATAPRIKQPVIAERYEVRHLDLHTLDSEMQQARSEAKSDVQAPRAHSKALTAPAQKSPDAPPPVLHLALQAPRAKQTLLQPDLPKPVALNIQIPVPTVVISAPARPQVKTIVPPLPQKPVVANVKPSLQPPNNEPNLADFSIPASDLALRAQPVLPGTATPLVVNGPKPTPPAAITTAQGSALSSPATVISLSNNRMANGAVALPPVNTSAAANSPGVIAPDNNSAQNGHGKDATKQNSAPANSSSAQSGSGQAGYGMGSHPLSTHISRQKDGQFASVVVGSSLAEKYPETAELWSGRLSYTVYLPVGLAKSWILQFSLSRDDNAADAGGISHLEAPWPFSIMRPNLEPGSLDSDALFVHGFIDAQGHFESLAVAFPPDFAQAQFVLGALRQWQFRPAMQNGQGVKVEILLIIPEVQD